MTSFLMKLASVLGLLFAVVALNFLLIQFAPGDPVEVIVGEMAAPRTS